MLDLSNPGLQPAPTEEQALAARRALRRQLLVAGAPVIALGALVAAARLGGISLATIDRPLLIVGVVAAVAVFRAGRSVWRVWREGIGAAVPAPPAALEPAPRSELDAHDRFLVVQKFRWFGGRYELSLLAPDGRSPGEPVAVVDREAFAAKERLEARHPDVDTAGYVDAGRAAELHAPVFVLQAQQILDLGGAYRVERPDGHRIGELRKVFETSLFRATWEIWDGTGTLVATAQERSLPVALLRRAIELIPLLGELLGLLPIPYHFDVHAAPNGHEIATFTRLRTVRDRYVLTIDGDPGKAIDRRLMLALAVALDALQAR